MRLSSFRIIQNASKDGVNPWEIENLGFGKRNLIIGRNATGKTRIVAFIHWLALEIQLPIQFPKFLKQIEWSAEFIDEGNKKFEYGIAWEEGKIIHEKIVIDSVDKLLRSHSSAKIFSELTNTWQEISPPNDRLVLQIRRDKNEFPFLENLVNWAEGVKGFTFANTFPNLIELPGNPLNLRSLNAVPSALDNLQPHQLKKVLEQLESIGFDLENASTGLVQELPPQFKMVLIKERGVDYPLLQLEISQGMFRALSLLVIIEFLRSNNGVGTLLIDDLGEGLDFERSKKLAEIIFNEVSDSKIQLIATSNDSFLMNAIPLDDLIICHRLDHKVKCLNYLNSKDKFEQWKQLGLNNFDLFSSNFLLS